MMKQLNAVPWVCMWVRGLSCSNRVYPPQLVLVPRPLLTFRNLLRRNVNQLVSIFSATDSVLEEKKRRKESEHERRGIRRARFLK